ncbi:PKD-like family lipoprotein [Chitinophaga sedimenti]|uniref:PKD-like family lipoprotein n=1 Tax=Chitinophaga sedimenti TaxID=2033606 RepID=UPI002005F8D8|nr:PKD-like family lipoprotein [Chitinophaga sedimenti]MCK7553688.1 PKD-like family lipoprotein [Chitinophaga sedimenti]
MKIIYSAIAACFVLLSSACYKDHGNYDYLEPEAITIGGMVSTYTRMSLLDSIIINPEVTSSDPAAEFTYFWGIYETNAQGFIPKLDTIARTKELRYFVTQPAKTWVLVFGATNKHTGVTKTRTANMVVITSFTRGWYVLQDDGTNTDLDMFLTRSAIKPDSAIRNVYSLANNQKLPGRAKYLCFNSSYKTYAAGTTAANTRTLFLFSENELAATNINTLLDVRRLDQLFYGPPATKKPAFSAKHPPRSICKTTVNYMLSALPALTSGCLARRR